MTRLRNFLFWLVGVDASRMAGLPRSAGMPYEALGWIFLLNYGVLVGAWGLVGLHFFGLPGLLAPGLLVPSVFLAFDRLVAQVPRRLKGHLATFDLPDTAERRQRFEVGLRILMALVLTSCTTFTFLIGHAAPLIAAKTQKNQREANSPLLKEYKERVISTFDSREQHLNKKISRLSARYRQISEQATESRELFDRYEQQATLARLNAEAERGGLDGRVKTCGSKCKAYQAQAAEYESRAAEIRSRLEGLGPRLAGVTQSLDSTEKALSELSQQRAAQLAEVPGKLPQDPRFVPLRRGFFADATTFISLFRDPAVAPGLWLVAGVVGGCLFALECVALVGLSIRPSTGYDVDKLALERVTCQRIVTEAEQQLEQLNKQRPQVRVIPHPSSSPPRGGYAEAGESGQEAAGGEPEPEND